MFSPYTWLHRLGSLSTPQLVAVISFFAQLYFFVPVMTPYLQGKGLSLAQIAGMQTVLMVTQLVMELPSGVLADMLGHRRSYQIALILAVAGEVITLLSNTYPQFLSGQVVAGTGFAFASGSVDVLVYESLPEGDRTSAMQRAKGRIGAAVQLGSVFAYSVGAWITRELTMDRMRLTLKLDVVGVGMSVLIGFMLRDPIRHLVTQRPTMLGLLHSGLAPLRHNAVLRRLVLISIVTNAFVAHLLVFYQEYFRETGVAPIWLGLGLSLGSVVAFFTQLHAWRLPVMLGNRRGLLIATGLPGVLYLLMAANAHPVLAVMLFVAQWGIVQLALPLFSGLFNEHIAPDARATSLSLINGIVTVYIGIGGVALGWLAEVSLPLMFAILGGVILLGTAFVRPNPETT
ncbi:MAG TPA: MFS transporter [Thermomicrobiales bacterium]|nr:MFS transporter [Thermomicrobiales bacterium]